MRPELYAEAERQLDICNACRYCEGYCAVFPSLSLREVLDEGRVEHLANLCHDCRACFQACMYAEPHEFAVNLPSLLADVRAESYERNAWPSQLARLFRHGYATVLLVSLLGLVAILISLAAAGRLDTLGERHTGEGAFYVVVPYLAMLVPALVVTGFVLFVWVVAFVGYWRRAGIGPRPGLGPWLGAAGDALALRWLRGGGGGCYYPDRERPAHGRRLSHSLVVYGLLAAFASTVAAAMYQEFGGVEPPYAVSSLPVILGLVGGLAICVGVAGLSWLKWRSARDLGSPRMLGLDTAFLILLGLTSASGLLLLFIRETTAMGAALVVHLALVLGLYVTAPYGKLVHAVYRVAALVANRVEQRAEGLSARSQR